MIFQVSPPKTNCSPLKVYTPFQKGRLVSLCHHFSGAKNVSFRNPCTLLGTLKMIFLFQWWDILVPWSVSYFYWRLNNLNSFYLQMFGRSVRELQDPTVHLKFLSSMLICQGVHHGNLLFVRFAQQKKASEFSGPGGVLLPCLVSWYPKHPRIKMVVSLR